MIQFIRPSIKTIVQVSQGYERIRQWTINWCTYRIMIHVITSSVDYLQLVVETFGPMDTKLDKPNDQNPIKVPKVVKSTNKKTLL